MHASSLPTHRNRAVLTGTLVAVLALGLMAGPAFAGKGGGGGKPGGGGCTPKAPVVAVDNTWAWGQGGSFGLPGQRLMYAMNVINYDIGCRASTFGINIKAPNGFTVELPATSISVSASNSKYVYAYVTSPVATADGDYALTVTVTRSGSTFNTGSTDTKYRVYSSDSVSPTLYWPSPDAGATVSGSSLNFAVSSNDDHAVKSIELYIDGAYRSTTDCDDVSASCQFYYTSSVAAGQHTATFKSNDWLGNSSVLTSDFSAS